jgi:hypothetical protein
LISPWFTLPDAGSPRLDFNHWYSFNHDDYGVIEVNVGTGEWQALRTVEGTSNGQWFPTNIDLQDYRGQKVQLGFRFHSQIHQNGNAYTAAGWYLDAVELRSNLLWVEPEQILFEGLSVAEGTLGSFKAVGAADRMTYGLSGDSLPGAQIDPDLGLFTWSPPECYGPGLYFATVSLRDQDQAVIDLLEVPIIVTEVNAPPIVDPLPDIPFEAGTEIQVQVTAIDTDCPVEQAVTFSLDTAPPGAAIGPDSGLITWTPSAEQSVSSQPFVVRVTDDGAPDDDDQPPASTTVSFTAFPQGPTVTAELAENGCLEISLTGNGEGASYRLITSVDLVHWIAMEPEVVFTDGEPQCVVGADVLWDEPMRFYRIERHLPR